MIEKIKSSVLYIAQNITDVRVLGQVVFGFLVLLVSWSCVKAIQTNANLQKQIATMEQKVQVQKLETQNLELKNKYLETDQFLEISARRQFGKARPGETVWIVPKTVAQAHSVELAAQTKNNELTIETEQPFYEKNLTAWRNFFFHRNN